MEISDYTKHYTAKAVQPTAVATESVQPNGLRPRPENSHCYCLRTSHSRRETYSIEPDYRDLLKRDILSNHRKVSFPDTFRLSLWLLFCMVSKWGSLRLWPFLTGRLC